MKKEKIDIQFALLSNHHKLSKLSLSKIWPPNVGLEPTTLRLRVSCSTD